jgi:hypothetical protein
MSKTMNNETKRDVFEDMALRYTMYLENVIYENGNRHSSDKEAQHDADKFRARYAAALPDDLPVIPKVVSEYIQWGKSYDIKLYMMYSFKFIHSQGFKKLTDDVESWIISSSNAFAIAWLLGVWRVEETGEIVKLEENK